MRPEFVNIDFSPHARFARHPKLAKFLYSVGIVSEQRWKAFQSVDSDIICHDLRRGLPFPDASFEFVYHSHFLEHLSRENADKFIAECLRVLRPHGLIRVVVPDLELLCRKYLRTIDQDADSHLQSIANIFELMVRMDTAGTSAQKPVVRYFERIIRGNAFKTGQLHQWMYDRVSLGRLLSRNGFCEIIRRDAISSDLPSWEHIGLDTEPDGTELHPGSLFMEARAG